ncbi:thioredoxin-disulfide reductase [Exophiala xenobiotica]|uniref:Thioredoxin reductase n=1 Tax=Vermiconidia calcicola TaxID=1690605 RepID=A0AAV9Q521_9PEZI|nr:thioredoxin-disulfide reductase [Exophiala xenobiotica]KAK5535037.1 thioredoxin-disulfide reductase [Vermiconidia calcicola]KAK5536217.1 thioredoxin-disulfide reductase [Chaetothyriales sp. CCFEE 6169]KAK5209246.1 thioredoxin-disulfide reductase [Exophiala xenobiotica]KAK5223972.1 thioredoxin-disulfide reductase [Exophiala xenobiotica]
MPAATRPVQGGILGIVQIDVDAVIKHTSCGMRDFDGYLTFRRRAANFPLHSSISLSLAASSILLQRPQSPAIARSFSSSLGAMAPPHTKVAIIGSGPAAHTAAIYLSRAELKPVMYEGMLAGGTAAGGQLTTTTDVENFPGFSKGIGGMELMDEMKAQSERFGTEIITETITKVDLKQRPFRLWREYEDGETDEVAHTADAVIIATGANARRLNLAGEETYWQNGISACAVCDGAVPIFRNKPLVVIGGGDSAAEEAMFLTKYGSHVTVLVRKDKLRASKTMAKRLLANPKVTVKFNHVAVEVQGENKPRGLMTHLKIKDVKTGAEEVMDANGLFYAVGHDPATAIFKGQVDTDEEGYIVTQPGTSYTNIPGVFAAGDVQDKRYRQAITSAGSGCIAALEAEKYLADLEDDELNLEKENQAKKPETNGETNGETAPEYRSNPLL